MPPRAAHGSHTAEVVVAFPEAYFVDVNEAGEPRVMAAEADARADVAKRAA
jgi:hypothetical protein